MKLILGVLMVALLGPGHSCHTGLPAPVTATKMAQAYRIASTVGRAIKARVIGCSICKGMTCDQVRPLVWGDSSITFVPWTNDTVKVVQWYKDCDLFIYWISDDEGILRVDTVEYWPIFR
jgi:hypothetical protein